MGKHNETRLSQESTQRHFFRQLRRKMNSFLVSMILGLAIGIEASASLGIGQKVDTDEAINELKEMDASPSLEIRQNADLKDVLSKFIKEVKDNDAKHNAEIAELKKLKAEITKNKNDIAAVKRNLIQCITGYTEMYIVEKSYSTHKFYTK